MPDEKFKLPQSSYDELIKIIKAYGHFDEPTELTEVSRFISLNSTVISRNAGFLTSVGILQTGAKKALTPSGRDLAHALEHSMPDEIRRWWRKIVDDNDFLSKILAAIRIRNGMDQQTLEAHVAYSAGQPKKPAFMTGARTVIDILKAAEAIREADGKYISDTTPVAVEAIAPTIATTAGVATVRGIASPTSTAQGSSSMFRLQTPQAEAVVRININVNCSPEELDGLGKKIRDLLKELEQDADQEGTQAQ